MLNRYEITYFYEHPLAVVDEGKTRIWYPDFQLRGLGILIEYFGMPDAPSYCSGLARKEAVYAANGISAITITPDQFRGEWPTKILGRIESILKDRVLTTRAAIKG